MTVSLTSLAGLAGRAIDKALDASIAGGFGEPGYLLRRHLPAWPDDPRPNALVGKHIAVTGASSGIGVAASRQLSDLGAHVHLIVRNPDKATPVAAALPGASTVWMCDLADLDSVATCAKELDEKGIDLSGLVHNAGVMPARHTLTPQGFEQSMAVHVLGPALLTELLRRRLSGGRVVLVTSGGMYAQRLRIDDLAYLEEPYRPAKAYARSKRAQVELLQPLQDRWSDLTVAAMHPGWVDTPGVRESLPGFARLTHPVLRDADAGADTITWLAATETRLPGGRLWHDRQVRPSNRLGRTAAGHDERDVLLDWVYEALEPWLEPGRNPHPGREEGGLAREVE